MEPLVLVVEDYPETQEIYREFLTFSGFRVALASTGQEAVDKARELCPDIILMDLSLPGMDGWEATREIRKDPRLQAASIVVLSGHARPGMDEVARRAGCTAFIAKPCSPTDLVAKLRALLPR